MTNARKMLSRSVVQHLIRRFGSSTSEVPLRCQHGLPMLRACPVCLCSVGSEGPPRVEVGQVWFARNLSLPGLLVVESAHKYAQFAHLRSREVVGTVSHRALRRDYWLWGRA